MLKIDDVTEYHDPIHLAFLQALNVRSELLVPIRTTAYRIGVLCLHHSQPLHWDEEDVDLLKSVSNHLAIAIEQAQVYAESRAKSLELERTLAQLKQTQAQMVQSEKMSSLGQLVAGVAHEINNPINFIHGNIMPASDYIQDLLDLLALYQTAYPTPSAEILEHMEVIDLDFLTTDLLKLLKSMRVGTSRIREIVLSLRNFSRLDEADFKEANLHEGIDNTLLILQHRLQDSKLRDKIEIQKDYGELPLVHCYPGPLNQVLMNLFSNAIDALDEHVAENRAMGNPGQHIPTITIKTQCLNPDQVKITIADNGGGIPEVIRLRLFDPFFTTKPVGKGTGLGLSISYQIITEKHGGQLWCESVPGEGTQFHIVLPIVQPDPMED